MKTIIDICHTIGVKIVYGCYKCQKSLPPVIQTPHKRARYENELRRSGVIDILYGTKAIQQYLATRSSTLTHAIISFPHVAREIIPLVHGYAPHCIVIYDMVDFHALRLYREAELLDSMEKRSAAGQMESLELQLISVSDIVFAVSDSEAHLVRDKMPTATVAVVPNIFVPPVEPPADLTGRSTVLFLGGFWHRPNADAVTWFANEVWPIVTAQRPDATFIIAGSNVPPEVLLLAKRQGVDVIGYVADLNPLFGAARVFVAPLRFGAGMKGKVGQAMTFGVPVVSTSVGAEGMLATPGDHLLLADDPASFAAHVLRLLQDDSVWEHVQSKALQLMRENFSKDRVQETLKFLLETSNPAFVERRQGF